jgi:hypothetical protein
MRFIACGVFLKRKATRATKRRALLVLWTKLKACGTSAYCVRAIIKTLMDHLATKQDTYFVHRDHENALARCDLL